MGGRACGSPVAESQVVLADGTGRRADAAERTGGALAEDRGTVGRTGAVEGWESDNGGREPCDDQESGPGSGMNWNEASVEARNFTVEARGLFERIIFLYRFPHRKCGLQIANAWQA